jgi:hypothetical protein
MTSHVVAEAGIDALQDGAKSPIERREGDCLCALTVSLETYANLLPAETLNAFTVERRAKQWQQIIEIEIPNSPDDTGVFVAEENAKIVGFGCCSRQRYEDMTAILLSRSWNGPKSDG